MSSDIGLDRDDVDRICSFDTSEKHNWGQLSTSAELERMSSTVSYVSSFVVQHPGDSDSLSKVQTFICHWSNYLA